MLLKFDDGSVVTVILENNPLGQIFGQCYKHLSSLVIPVRPWDNPYYLETISYDDLVQKMVMYGDRLSITVDPHICMRQDQDYFNYLHKIYENLYDGKNPDWLDFHEHIHLCESYYQTDKLSFFQIDYREKAGLLQKTVKPEWLTDKSTYIRKGQIFAYFAELGKTPYDYWNQNEPEDPARLCELAKPWLTIKPKLCIAVHDIDTMANIKADAFNHWWKRYHDIWKTHWKMDSYTLEDMCGVIIIGSVPDIDILISKLKTGSLPSRVSMQ